MATVKIGSRDLAVWHRQDAGALGKTKKLIQAEAALQAAAPADLPDRMADVVACYVGHNEGVTSEWLLDQLPADCGDLLRACIEATGRKVAPPGEAKSP